MQQANPFWGAPGIHAERRAGGGEGRVRHRLIPLVAPSPFLRQGRPGPSSDAATERRPDRPDLRGRRSPPSLRTARGLTHRGRSHSPSRHRPGRRLPAPCSGLRGRAPKEPPLGSRGPGHLHLNVPRTGPMEYSAATPHSPDASFEPVCKLVGELSAALQDRAGLVLVHRRNRRELGAFVQSTEILNDSYGRLNLIEWCQLERDDSRGRIAYAVWHRTSSHGRFRA